MPELNRVHITTAEKPNTEPTDRSNSPELDGGGERVADVEDRQEVGVDRVEHGQLESEQDGRAELRLGDQALKEGTVFHGRRSFRVTACRGGREPGIGTEEGARQDPAGAPVWPVTCRT
jgi:hypothetical protein